MNIKRKITAAGAAGVTLAALLSGCAAAAGTSAGAGTDPIVFGVSGPLTGEQAQYGKDWQMGFELFLEQINADGGVDGREVQIDFQDSQGDPSQATTIAQRFVSDEKISAVMGDFSSATSMVASPLYQRGGLLQLGITNSHPDFTKSGDFVFSPAVTQETDARVLENLAAEQGDKIALIYLNTDWGKTASDIFADEAEENDHDLVMVAGVEEASTDFKPLLLQVKDSGADVVVYLTYYNTTSLLVQQATQVGLTDVANVAVGSNYSPQFLDLAGDAAEGVYLTTTFFPGDDREEVTDFVSAFEEMHGTTPNLFSAFAYDGLQQLVWAYEDSDGSREGIRDALRDGKDIPSVIFGPFAYNEERRIDDPTITPLLVENGLFVKAE